MRTVHKSIRVDNRDAIREQIWLYIYMPNIYFMLVLIRKYVVH
jgi:hypothetical protein